MTSTANDLSDRLRKRLENERREIEELTASELKRLAENSRRFARNALCTIERDTEEATGRMRELLAKAWLRPLIVGLSLWETRTGRPGYDLFVALIPELFEVTLADTDLAKAGGRAASFPGVDAAKLAAPAQDSIIGRGQAVSAQSGGDDDAIGWIGMEVLQSVGSNGDVAVDRDFVEAVAQQP